MAKGRKPSKTAQAAEYRHKEQAPARPDVGTQPQFRKKAPPRTYRYDSSLSPALDWDGGNGTRELGEWLLRTTEEAAALPAPHEFPEPREFRDGSGRAIVRVAGLHEAVAALKAVSQPFLNWAGKAERLSFDVPTLPLFVHERLSTRAILETLKGRKRDKQLGLFDLFADPQRPIHDQVLRAYEYQDDWVNRMILGDSLVVMNSLLHYESLGGQVQMIYMDPPYGVKFGSNFQPFVRRKPDGSSAREVTHNSDEDMTREPEMVQAYRDTWELGLHSYLTYLRDRLLLCRELLTASGSIFVQISDENIHHVRELMDEVFGAENFCAQIAFKAADPLGQKGLARVYDYIVWYARSLDRIKYRPLFRPRDISEDREYRYVGDPTSAQGHRTLSDDEFSSSHDYAGIFRRRNLTSSGFTESCTFEFELSGRRFFPAGGKSWSTNRQGIEKLKAANRLFVLGKDPYFKSYHTDFPFVQFDNGWTDKPAARAKAYVVQTAEKFVERCMLMTTDPGDIVFDPTCGSGTTAYVAEQWGRRWITTDTSRVPLALARQRLLTATFLWYELKDESRGPAGGFVYKRRQNSKGEEEGGIVPHITLKSIANDEPPKEEILVDRPEKLKGITRVTGPFAVEATIPTAIDPDAPAESASQVAREQGDFVDRMLEVLRRSPVLRLGGNRAVTLRNVRRPAKALALSAEAVVDTSANGKSQSLTDAVQSADEANRVSLPFSGKPVALVFGPENGAVAERLVWEAAREAHAKSYSHLYVIGFAIQPPARGLVDNCEQVIGIPATYVQATPDLMMGDLLKNMRSSQIFSVCGLPEVELKKTKQGYVVRLLGLDVFDPATMEVDHRKGDDVPAWLLDSDYNGLSFHVSQAFFPRTAAWDNLKRSLKGEFEDSVWDHLAGTESVPFEGGDHKQVAVKVIDDRGNELMVIKPLGEAR